ncbi:hypothetical protein X808_20200 [Mannheimia varigena USDA-ARS-USMARC-1296]|uniref:Uncharacterized protein n=1 Tax=Mannheimia varigena USDA-ARS-USMARC-1296 TaxID=1433287 RepID=W0QH09_9PAST|nr:hypothetical protein X808_20200 [Mannheimia varigena USDA-ARS-USMARC-1296]
MTLIPHHGFYHLPDALAHNVGYRLAKPLILPWGSKNPQYNLTTVFADKNESQVDHSVPDTTPAFLLRSAYFAKFAN